MNVKIEKGRASGRITAPPSKSYAHRLLIASALAGEGSIVENIAQSEDILATLNCIKNLGIEYKFNGSKVDFLSNKKPRIKGVLDCNDSGSTMRFMIPLALTTGENVTLKGTERLISRGVGIYKEVLKGVSFTQTPTEIKISGKLQSGVYEIKGDISSQFITGLVYALPLLKGDSVIKILPPVESRSYIEMSVYTLSLFGIKIDRINENEYKIKGSQKFLPSCEKVEGDWSNSAFMHALNEVGGNAIVDGLNPNSLQGDKAYLDAFEKLNKGFAEIDLGNCPDLAPVLFAVASVKNGAKFINTKRLKIKESDRALVMAEELKKFGVICETKNNFAIVYKSELKKPSVSLYGHNDHRIVMALSVLLTLTGGKIEGAEAVKKSYPNFFEDLVSLGINVEYEN